MSDVQVTDDAGRSAQERARQEREAKRLRKYSTALGIFYLFLALLLVHTLYELWPQQPWPGKCVASKSGGDGNTNANNTNGNTNNASNTNQSNSATNTSTSGGTSTNTGTGNGNAGSNANGNGANTNNGNANNGNVSNTNTTGTSNGNAASRRTGNANNTNTGTTNQNTSDTGSPGSKNPSPQSSPETASNPRDDPSAVCQTTLFFIIPVDTTFETRLLLLVIVAAALGSFVHASTSLVDFVGNERFKSTWNWWYLQRPFIGAALALVFYFVVRGGLFSATATSKDTTAINPFGIAAIAGLVGMFSKQATDKLDELFNTLFRTAQTHGDTQRSDPLVPQPPEIKGIIPPSLKKGATDTKVTIEGLNFEQGATVQVNGQDLTPSSVTATTIVVTLPTDMVAATGTLKIAVTNPKPHVGISKVVEFMITE